ncbi:MAG: hypothetical protein HOH16_13105 [Planctomycetaceae bacterium]|nr:hypothetical protein [Planctomycetaceae bacterium]
MPALSFACVVFRPRGMVYQSTNSYRNKPLLDIKIAYHMGIICLCPNGHRTKLKDRFAGLRVRCPQCGDKFQVPEKNLSAQGDKTTMPAFMPATQQADFDSPFNDDHVLLKDERVITRSNTPTNLHAAKTPSILKEDTSQLWRIAPPGGEPSHAMVGTDLLALLSSSEISPKDYVWRTDWAEWKPVITVFPEFFPNS